MISILRRINILHRRPEHEGKEQLCPGDVFEVLEPEIREVDPVTRKSTEALQCFRVHDDGQSLRPVRRGSWLAAEDRQVGIRMRYIREWDLVETKKFNIGG